MLRSMTGFGKGEAQNAFGHYSLQLKSVNNRFLELGLKLSQELWAFEGEARTLVQAKLARGKVDMVWKDLPLPQAPASVGVDLDKAKAYQSVPAAAGPGAWAWPRTSAAGGHHPPARGADFRERGRP